MLRVIIALLLFLLAPSAAWAEKRVALVIGNAAYKHAGELANPKNDAEDFAAALKALEMEVIKGINLDKAAMDREIRKFSAALSKAAWHFLLRRSWSPSERQQLSGSRGCGIVEPGCT